LNGQPPSPSHSLSPTPTPGPRPILPTHLTVAEGEGEEEEEIDDTMLVMTVEPGVGPGKHRTNNSISWAKGVQGAGSGPSGTPPPLPTTANGGSRPVSPPSAWSDRTHRGQGSNGSNLSGPPPDVRSLHTSNGAAPSYPSFGKARSVISIEGAGNGAGNANGGKKGSISVGRGTTRKSSGAGVEALGINAEGFFAPPGIPTSPRVNGGRREGNDDAAS
jgi:Rho GTPase-activating protein 1